MPAPGRPIGTRPSCAAEAVVAQFLLEHRDRRSRIAVPALVDRHAGVETLRRKAPRGAVREFVDERSAVRLIVRRGLRVAACGDAHAGNQRQDRTSEQSDCLCHLRSLSLFHCLPGSIISARHDRGRGRIGPPLCPDCCLWVIIVAASRRSARSGVPASDGRGTRQGSRDQKQSCALVRLPASPRHARSHHQWRDLVAPRQLDIKAPNRLLARPRRERSAWCRQPRRRTAVAVGLKSTRH